MQTLTSIATNVVGQYSQAGKLIVGTYRSGAQRFITSANTRYVAFMSRRALPLVSEAARASLLEVHQQIVGLVEGGIVAGTGRAEQAIDFLAGSVNGRIERIAATTQRLSQRVAGTEPEVEVVAKPAAKKTVRRSKARG